MPLNSLSNVKTAKSSPARAHTRSSDLDPYHGLGGPYTRKKLFRTRVLFHTQQPQHVKKVLNPRGPTPHPLGFQKWGTQVMGVGGGVKIKTIIGGSFSVPK